MYPVFHVDFNGSNFTKQGILENRIGIFRIGKNNMLWIPEMYKLLKQQYDGYHFSKRMTDIYNPYQSVERS